MASIAADGTVIGSALINLFDRHEENEQAEASGSILAVSLHEKRVSSQAALILTVVGILRKTEES